MVQRGGVLRVQVEVPPVQAAAVVLAGRVPPGGAVRVRGRGPEPVLQALGVPGVDFRFGGWHQEVPEPVHEAHSKGVEECLVAAGDPLSLIHI